VVNAADNPASTPAATLLAAACGSPQLVTALPPLTPCGAACFCLTRARISGGVLTITGHGLKGVAKVEVNATGCNPGSGTNVPLGNATKTDTKITVPFGGNFTQGTNVILSSPLGPSSSCSSPCTTASACPF
jgi:hypothetical protein